MNAKWPEVTLNDIAINFAMGPFGSNITTDNFVPKGVPVIRGVNLPFDKKFNSNDFVFLTEEKADELRSSNANADDIVITHRGTLGQVGIVPRNTKYKRFVVSQSQMKFSCKPDVLDPNFIYYFLKSPIGQHRLLANTSATGVPAIARPLTSLKAMLVNLPLLPVQRQIASILSSLDDKIELNNRINKTLEEMVQAIFRRWFVDFEFPDENGNPYKSAGGEMVRLDQLVDFNPTERLNKANPVLFFDMSCLSNTGMEMNEGVIRDTPTGSCFREYDVLIAKITPCLENGKTGLVLDLEDNQVACGSTEFIVMRAKMGVSPFWVYCLARTPEFREKAITSMTGTSGRQRVQVNAIKEYLVSFDIDKMRKFDNLVRPMVEKIYTNISENRRLSVCRDALLPKLMSGSISVS